VPAQGKAAGLRSRGVNRSTPTGRTTCRPVPAPGKAPGSPITGGGPRDRQGIGLNVAGAGHRGRGPVARRRGEPLDPPRAMSPAPKNAAGHQSPDDEPLDRHRGDGLSPDLGGPPGPGRPNGEPSRPPQGGCPVAGPGKAAGPRSPNSEPLDAGRTERHVAGPGKAAGSGRPTVSAQHAGKTAWGAVLRMPPGDTAPCRTRSAGVRVPRAEPSTCRQALDRRWPNRNVAGKRCRFPPEPGVGAPLRGVRARPVSRGQNSDRLVRAESAPTTVASGRNGV
jgi:hypothetical protein